MDCTWGMSAKVTVPLSDSDVMAVEWLRTMVSVLTITLGTCALLPDRALAHGAVIEARQARAVTIYATFDSGEPMVGAQVSVFSPENPEQPWLQGLTNEQGRFIFIPGDAAGRWAIQARQAGHGSVTYLDVSARNRAEHTSMLPTTSEVGISPVQRVVMAVSVVWGMIGTALYFRRKGTA